MSMVAVTYSQINDAFQSLRNYNVVEITLPSYSAMSEQKIGYCISISNWRELHIQCPHLDSKIQKLRKRKSSMFEKLIQQILTCLDGK